jgi:CheY-like chemotaxis protein
MTHPVVLIVDDDARNRKLARDVLALAGFGTLEAATGEEAIAIACEQLPDVVLLDLRLPDLDGAEVVRRLKAARATAEIPVVALTAVTGARQVLGAAGFAGYVEKPFDVAELPSELRRHCAAR